MENKEELEQKIDEIELEDEEDKDDKDENNGNEEDSDNTIWMLKIIRRKGVSEYYTFMKHLKKFFLQKN